MLSSKYLLYFKVILASFYSDTIYKDVLNNWRGFGLRYLFLVSFVSALLVAVTMLYNLGRISPARVTDAILEFILLEPDLPFEENINRFLSIAEQIPKITITNGLAYADVAQPYFINDPVSKYDIAIIDTTGKYKSLAESDAFLLLTSDKLLTKTNKITSLSDLGRQFNIDENTINEVLSVLSQIPKITLESGKFVTESDELYKIYDSKNNDLVQIGKNAILSEKTYPILAITADEINYKNIFSNKSGTIKVAELDEAMLADIIISGARQVKNIILYAILVVALPLISLMAFSFNLMMLLFYSFIGHSFIKIMKLGQFEYKQVMRIVAVAITPMLLASVILPKYIPSQGIVYFVISIGYIYYAIKAVAPNNQTS